MSNDRIPDNPIVTEFINPPIPIRCCDWHAHRKDYDGAPDSNDPIGFGHTEESAIVDLLDKENA